MYYAYLEKNVNLIVEKLLLMYCSLSLIIFYYEMSFLSGEVSFPYKHNFFHLRHY